MSFARGLGNQAQVIHALALRETRTRYGTNQLGYLWAIGEPIVWILSFYGMFAMMNRPAPVGMDLVGFLATGVIPYNCVMQVSGHVAAAIAGNRALLVYPHVQPLDLMIARIWLEVGTLLAVFAMLMLANAAVIGDLVIDDPLKVLTGFGLAAALGGALGLVFCVVDEVLPSFPRIRGPVLRPLFWVSGIYFTASSVPLRLRELLLYNPILHCLELVRDGWFRSYDAPHVDRGYVVAWILVCLFLGLTLERVVRRKVKSG